MFTVGVGVGARPGQVGPLLVHEADDVRQCRIVAQLAVFIARDVVDLADGGEHFCLLDGVDAEIGFEIEIEIEHVVGIAGLLDHQRQDALLHRIGRRRLGLAGAVGTLRSLSVGSTARQPATGAGCRIRLGSWPRGCRGRRALRCRRLCRRRLGVVSLESLPRPVPARLIAHPQGVVNHFQIRGRTARHPAQPCVPRGRVGDAIGVAQGIRAGRTPSFGRTQRKNIMLICEPNPAPRCMAYSTGIGAAFRQVQRTQLGINFLEVGAPAAPVRFPALSPRQHLRSRSPSHAR